MPWGSSKLRGHYGSLEGRSENLKTEWEWSSDEAAKANSYVVDLACYRNGIETFRPVAIVWKPSNELQA